MKGALGSDGIADIRKMVSKAVLSHFLSVLLTGHHRKQCNERAEQFLLWAAHNNRYRQTLIFQTGIYIPTISSWKSPPFFRRIAVSFSLLGLHVVFLGPCLVVSRADKAQYHI